MGKQLVLIGGGHAHMLTLDRLDSFIQKGFSVTVIQPSDYHYYSGMGPGMLGGTYEPEDIRFATRRQVEAYGGRFIKDKAVAIDPAKQLVYLKGGREEICYDVLSCNAGSYVADSVLHNADGNVFGAKPIEALEGARNAILEKINSADITVAVVGGGPSAAEIAGNVHQLCCKSKNRVNVLVFAGHEFFPRKPAKVQKCIREILLNKNIQIVEGERVERVEESTLTVAGGKEYQADVVFLAVGVKPSPIFSLSGLPVGADGGLLVNEYLQSTGYANIFGGGDCIDFAPGALDRVGVYAVRQNPVLYANLMASLEGKPLTVFDPGGEYLLIYNLGSGDGVLSKWFLTFSGKLTFYLKDYIDRKFIQSFQR